MRYTWGIVLEYQYQGAGIGIVLLVVKTLLYLIPNQYQYSTCKAAIRKKEITDLCISKNTRLVKQDVGARTPSAWEGINPSKMGRLIFAKLKVN
jgi:hypothetical protein